jgi:hypothetical protein
MQRPRRIALNRSLPGLASSSGTDRIIGQRYCVSRFAYGLREIKDLTLAEGESGTCTRG